MIFVPWVVFVVGIVGLIVWGSHTKTKSLHRDVTEQPIKEMLEHVEAWMKQPNQGQTQDITQAMVGGGQGQDKGQGQRWN